MSRKAPPPPPEPTPGDFLLYAGEDGLPHLQVRLHDGTVWLTQALMAELYGVSVKTVNEHLANIYDERELDAATTIRKFRIVRTEGAREVSRLIDNYSLPAILAVGYRVRSERGTAFRRWATALLDEFLVKGFVMDDARLKNPGGWDYFDELLARIRDIRASEKRFYQKVRDLFSLSADYRDNPTVSALFFAETQNKLLHAVTKQTAAEIVVSRADAAKPNMALTAWEGSRVRKADVITAKNYLTADEVDSLNRLVVIFLEQAELRVKGGKPLTLAFWRDNVDKLIAFQDLPVLEGNGGISHDVMKVIAASRYEEFDARRRADEARAADLEDERILDAAEKIEKLAKARPAKKPKKEGNA